MATKKSNNPLNGLTEAQIRALIDDADVSESDDDDDGPVEIVIRGANANTLLERLGFTQGKNYHPDEEDGEEDSEPPAKPKSKSGMADKLFGIKP